MATRTVTNPLTRAVFRADGKFRQRNIKQTKRAAADARRVNVERSGIAR